MTHSRFHLRAFTLMELILVLAIITLVVTIVGPKFSGFTTGRTTRNTATQILAMTHYARTQAVTQGRAYRLNYDSQANSLSITTDGDGSPASDLGAPLLIPDGIHVETDIPKQPTGQYIEFHPTGRTDPASIRLRDQFGQSIEVACSSATELFRIVPDSEAQR